MTELTRRYVVRRLASEAPFDPHDPDAPFVLKPWKDPAALRALAAYRDHCYPELARDLTAWIRIIEQGSPVPGDVGRRNAPYAPPPGTARRAGGPHRAPRPDGG
ncbi:MAG TPA: hypothetical protein VNO23_08870, partial [Candidatus Binatia bacterium]|nr:hypothetical protein [Candidatus Binatia bacterium]